MTKVLDFIKGVVPTVAILILAGVVAYDHLHKADPSTPTIPTAVDGVKLGKSFAADASAALAAGWDAGGDAISAGKSVADAQSALQEAWAAARTTAFVAKVAPEFAKVLPEGQEPISDLHRATIAKTWHDFAKGLRGGK